MDYFTIISWPYPNNIVFFGDLDKRNDRILN